MSDVGQPEIAPVEDAQRIKTLDVLRGLAILGILAVNAPFFAAPWQTALNPTLEGDATTLYLQRVVAPHGVKLTRLAHGVAVGSDLEYTDQATLVRALSGRREV